MSINHYSSGLTVQAMPFWEPGYSVSNTCTVVTKDKALEGMIDSEEEWMRVTRGRYFTVKVNTQFDQSKNMSTT